MKDAKKWVAPNNELRHHLNESFPCVDYNELVVVTCNVLYGTHQCVDMKQIMIRAKHMCKRLQKSKPHLLCFQHATPLFYQLLKEEPWIQQTYYLSDSDQAQNVDRIGLIIASSIPIDEIQIAKLPSFFPSSSPSSPSSSSPSSPFSFSSSSSSFPSSSFPATANVSTPSSPSSSSLIHADDYLLRAHLKLGHETLVINTICLPEGSSNSFTKQRTQQLKSIYETLKLDDCDSLLIGHFGFDRSLLNSPENKVIHNYEHNGPFYDCWELFCQENHLDLHHLDEQFDQHLIHQHDRLIMKSNQWKVANIQILSNFLGEFHSLHDDDDDDDDDISSSSSSLNQNHPTNIPIHPTLSAATSFENFQLEQIIETDENETEMEMAKDEQRYYGLLLYLIK